MALDSKNNIKSVFIIPDQDYTSFAKMFPGQDPGAVAVCDMSNNVFNTTDNIVSNLLVDNTGAPATKIKLVKDRGDGLPLQQVVLTLPSVATYTGAAGEAAREQVSYIGNNGVDGTIDGIDAITNNFFIIKLEHTPNSFIYGKRPASYKYGTYQSNASDTVITVCENLVKSLIANFRANRTTDWRVRSEVVCNDVLGSAPSATTFTLTKYSKSSVVTGTLPAVGDAIRIPDPGTGTATAQTAVYVVTAVNNTSNVVTFNYAYQGPSGDTAGSACRVAASYTSSLAGIKITGIKQKYDVNRWRQYDKVRFGVYLEGFTNSPVETTAAFDGVAVYEQVANDEYISWGDEGQIFVDQIPPLFREQDTVVGTQYTPLSIGWLDRLPSLIGAGENKGAIINYFETYDSTQGAAVIDLLDAFVLQKGIPGATFPALP
jgi:hypothetical protein